MVAPSAVSSLRFALRSSESGPWQKKQCLDRIGRTSRLKSICVSACPRQVRRWSRASQVKKAWRWFLLILSNDSIGISGRIGEPFNLTACRGMSSWDARSSPVVKKQAQRKFSGWFPIHYTDTDLRACSTPQWIAVGRTGSAWQPAFISHC